MGIRVHVTEPTRATPCAPTCYKVPTERGLPLLFLRLLLTRLLHLLRESGTESGL